MRQNNKKHKTSVVGNACIFRRSLSITTVDKAFGFSNYVTFIDC